ncbi:MAG: twin-arginine translocation signal domain-containing protein [Terriglobia bacterium]
MADKTSPFKSPESVDSSPSDNSRRDFLKSATTVAASLVVPAGLRAETSDLLPTVTLGPHRVTRLIVGSNPMYGYSHFNHLYDQHMLEWFTDERVVNLLLDCEKKGINTWQANFNYALKRQIPRLRDAGGKIQFICLAASWHYSETWPRTPEAILDGTVKCAQAAMEFKPIGIAFHGAATDILFRAGKIDMLKTYIDKVHDMGVLAGISTHNPAILDTLREKNFPNDFYMTGLHYLTRHPEDWMKEIGTLPLDEGWIASDPPKMVEAVRKVNKPALVYKVLAAGRRCGSAGEKHKAIEWAFKNIKPTDATIIGLYPRYSDQVSETTKMVREILA